MLLVERQERRWKGHKSAEGRSILFPCLPGVSATSALPLHSRQPCIINLSGQYSGIAFEHGEQGDRRTNVRTADMPNGHPKAKAPPKDDTSTQVSGVLCRTEIEGLRWQGEKVNRKRDNVCIVPHAPCRNKTQTDEKLKNAADTIDGTNGHQNSIDGRGWTTMYAAGTRLKSGLCHAGRPSLDNPSTWQAFVSTV